MDEWDVGIHARWCTKLLVDETNQWLPITVDVQTTHEWENDEGIHTRWCRINWWWLYQMMCKTSGDERDRWRKSYHMMYETTFGGWDQWRTSHTRWCRKLLLHERDEEVHARWYAIQLFMDKTNGELRIPDDVQYNCWWMRQMTESIPDDVWNNCWWMETIKECPYQMVFKTTV